MEDERDDSWVSVKGASGACDAAHMRAVMTVRLTLLLLIVGVALFFFTGPGGVLPIGPGSGDPVGRHK